jgi:hypothetical protein
MKDVHVLEFDCQAPLKFYERCSACPRFGEDCPDLQLGLEILRGKKKLLNEPVPPGEGVPASAFKCLAPLAYFEKTRRNCPHQGRCREEGLLIALLTGKRKLDYSRLSPLELSSRKPARVAARKKQAGQAAS